MTKQKPEPKEEEDLVSMTVSMPRRLRDAIDEAAEDDHRSRSNWVRLACAAALGVDA